MSRRSSEHKRTKFPLPSHLLPTVALTRAQCVELRQFALVSAQQAITDGPTWARSNVAMALRSGWKADTHTRNSCFLVKQDTHPEGREFMGHNKSSYTLEDVAKSLYCDNTPALRRCSANAFGNLFLDGCVIQTLESATPNDPFWYLGIKWLAVRSPFEKLMSHRDFAVLEHSGSHVDADTGQRTLYRIVESISLAKYGGTNSVEGFRRGTVQVAYVYFLDPDDGLLHVCVKGNAHPKGKTPIWMVDRYMQRLWRAGLSICDANLDDYASSDDLEDSDDQAHELATRWVADRDRSHCYVCEKRFHRVGRMRHHCRACGEVVCRSCTQYEQLSVPSLGMPLLGTPRASSSSSGGLGSSSASVNEMRLSQSSSVCSMSSSSSSSTRRSLMTGRVCRKCVDKKRYGSRRKSTMVVREHHQRDRVQQLPLRPRHYSEEVFTTQATGIVIDVEPCAVLGDDDDSDDCDGVPVLDVPSDEDDDKDDDVSDVTTITVGSPSTRSTIASRSDGSQPSLSCFDPDLLLDVNCATSARAPPPPPPVYMHATPSQQELHILERIRNLQHGLKRSHSAKHAPNSSWSSSYVPLTLRSSWTTQVSKSMGSSVASSSASTFLGSMRSSSSSSFLCPSISMSSEDANEELLSSRGTNVNCKVPSVVPPTPAMAQVEASIADQAYLLYCIQTERTKSQLRRQQSPQLA